MTLLPAIILLLFGALLGVAIALLLRRPAPVPVGPSPAQTQEQQARAMREAFQALAAQALRESNSQFLDAARRVLEDVARQGQNDLDHRQQAVENLVRPVQEALGALQGEIHKVEGRREEAFTGLQNEIARLQRETGNLTTALRKPQGRGLWGEVTLRRVVESAGMSEHCDFSEQSVIEDREGRRFRPDLIVHLPGRREIAVDSKTPLDAYLDAIAAETEAARNEAMIRHAAQVRKQMELLSGKEYWSHLETSPEFVVLFLPGESFFSAALEQDRSLIEDAVEQRVILATPTTLIALLKAVAYGWRQEQMADNARRIGELGATLYERVAGLTEHLRDTGAALDRAVNSYNKAVGSYNARVLVAARKFRELQATPAGAGDIAPIEEVDRTARTGEVSQQSLDLG